MLGKVWDADKSRVCVCDPKWTDVDCSRKMCPKGNDPLEDCNEGYNTANHQIQNVCIFGASTGEFAIKYLDYYGGSYTTVPLAYNADAETVMDALLSLPDNAIDQVNVGALTESDCDPNSAVSDDGYGWSVTFLGHQVTGKQHTLELLTQECGDGCQPKLPNGLDASSTSVTISQAAETNMYECSRRGKCDYDSGICECFEGFTDEDCSVQSSLA
jgi:hypothetical protein